MIRSTRYPQPQPPLRPHDLCLPAIVSRDLRCVACHRLGPARLGFVTKIRRRAQIPKSISKWSGCWHLDQHSLSIFIEQLTFNRGTDFKKRSQKWSLYYCYVSEQKSQTQAKKIGCFNNDLLYKVTYNQYCNPLFTFWCLNVKLYYSAIYVISSFHIVHFFTRISVSAE